MKQNQSIQKKIMIPKRSSEKQQNNFLNSLTTIEETIKQIQSMMTITLNEQERIYSTHSILDETITFIKTYPKMKESSQETAIKSEKQYDKLNDLKQRNLLLINQYQLLKEKMSMMIKLIKGIVSQYERNNVVIDQVKDCLIQTIDTIKTETLIDDCFISILSSNTIDNIDNEMECENEKEIISIENISTKITTIQTNKSTELSSINTPNQLISTEKAETIQSEKSNDKIIETKPENNTPFQLTSNERKQIEEWTQRRIGTLLFNSEKDDWSQETSQFDKKVYGKEKILFLIEDKKNNLFGCYLHSKIDNYRWNENDEWKGERIEDPNCFVFTLRSNERNTFERFKIKYGNKKFAFTLHKSDDPILFCVGSGYDICLYKENVKQNSFCHQFSFTYGSKKNVFIGDSETELFIPKSIQVYQLI